MSAIGTDLKDIGEKAVEEIRKVISEAAANQPAIEDALVMELGAVGAPAPVASAIGAAVAALLNHFRSQQAPAVATSDSVATDNVEAPPAPAEAVPATPAPAEPQPTWSQVVAAAPANQ